ncbi:hypothetical protein [uncultured Polaribacter sp.]|uniref:hypothetical protein n=1 Tax=uncultured Polaribacter sp. TaxID=174711 RepID=UPI002615DE06|nr:hypothetical protein [uncultured Polaribacter sp.]
MDLLEKYKKAWDNQPEEKNKVSSIDIYKMAHSKSSSIVKWIFIVGVLELLFWSGINFFVPDSIYVIYEDLNLMSLLNVFLILHYVIILAFLFLFYKNYKKISIIDNTKKLIINILGIRKTVKYYVFYNLATFFLISVVFNSIIFSDENKLMKIMNPKNLSMDMSQFITITLISQIIALIIILTLLWLFYKLVYGILLKKLNRNYKELKKIDDLN